MYAQIEYEVLIIKNNYYVYEHIKLDDNTCIYVGKGSGRRAWTKARNPLHDEIVEKVGIRVNIIQDNLSEEEAFKLEREIISKYLDDGYGIDIMGMDDATKKGFLTNQALGGRGSYGSVRTDEWKKQHSLDMTGENNPAYGVNYWEKRNIEENNKLKENISLHNKGEANPMFGISPKERMDEATYEAWLQKKIKNSQGKNNPNYHNDTLKKKLENNPDLKLQYYSRPAAQNGRAREIYVYGSDGEFIRRFDYIGECAIWLKKYLHINTKPTTIRCAIITSITKNKLYKGYKFSYTKI